MFFVYFSLVQETWRDRQSFRTVFFEVLGTVIRDKQRSNKMQLEKNVVILVVFTVTPPKTKIKTVECLKLRISDIIEYR